MTIPTPILGFSYLQAHCIATAIIIQKVEYIATTQNHRHTFASHLVTSGTSKLRPVSVRSLTTSGNTAMKSLVSSLLTAVPVMTGGTGGARTVLIDLRHDEFFFFNLFIKIYGLYDLYTVIQVPQSTDLPKAIFAKGDRVGEQKRAPAAQGPRKSQHFVHLLRCK